MRLKKGKSIIRKLSLFLVAVIAVQACLFVGFILFGGPMGQLDRNAMDIFIQQVVNRKNYMENDMVQRWSELSRTQVQVQETVDAFLSERGLTYQDLSADNPETAELMERLTGGLIALMRRNVVTGAFVCLQGDKPFTLPAEGETRQLGGLYFRDMDPEAVPADNSDLLMERGSSEIIRNLRLTMDINWAPIFRNTLEDDAYYAPLLAALSYPGAAPADLGYWSGAFRLTGDELEIITYTQPLIGADGLPYGVIGVELGVDYLRSKLPYTEVNGNKEGAYLLAQVMGAEENGHLTFVPVAASGPNLTRIAPNLVKLCLEDNPAYQDVYYVAEENGGVGSMAAVQFMNLYNSNTPFEQQRWAVIGLVPQMDLFAFSRGLMTSIVALTLGVLVIGALVSLAAGTLFTKPIRLLVEKVRRLDPSQPVRLEPVDIVEIDALSRAIELLSGDVAQASSRLTQIIDMTGVSLAAFELVSGQKTAYYTKEFFSLIGRPQPQERLTSSEFLLVLAGIESYREEVSADGGTVVYKIPTGTSWRWLRMQKVKQDEATLGVVVDITKDMLEKRRIEYERDYDLLTSLLNRRAFQSRLTRLESNPTRLGVAAMVMMDLDNLKHVNDTYGHDCGDAYIQCAADVLRGLTAFGGLAARISGDEFHLLFSGYDNRESLKKTIALYQQRMAAAFIPLPDGTNLRLRASVGIAWYPEDSKSLTELIRFADFAMYEAKNAVKGSVKYFDVRTYQRDSFLLYSREELNRILEEEAVDYVFQPIVACITGAVMGYEALMRPRSKALPSPMEVMRIARSQSKLLQIERLTWFRSLESFSQLGDLDGEPLVFINSISSLNLGGEDLRELLKRFHPLLHRVCIELTESDELSDEATQVKQGLCREHGMRLAVDDYGTGYSNDSLLLSLSPHFVKVDMSIVRGIDGDKTRQTLFRNLTSLCRDMGAEVIAEGVESEAEMRTVVALGADYIQGYYFQRPALKPVPPPPESLELLRLACREAGR